MLEMTPAPTWFAGGNAITCAVSGLGSPGDWKMIAATTTGTGRIVVFGDPGLFRRFALPPVHPVSP